MVTRFIFSQIDPLDNVAPDCIIRAIDLDDKIYFELIIDEVPSGRKKPKSQFLTTQLQQFNIPLIKE